jgi:hypothetical protein
MIKASKQVKSFRNRYELSQLAFERVFKRRASLDEEDHAWIMGWQQGFHDARAFTAKT